VTKPDPHQMNELLSNVINMAKRLWPDLDMERDSIVGCESATFTEDLKVVIMRAKNLDGDDHLVTMMSEEFLLFALRLLNAKFGSVTPPSSTTLN
jgi:hypothetical protein